MIYPYNTPCPKCNRSTPATRYEPEVTEEGYQRQVALLERFRCECFVVYDIPTWPQKEHLVVICPCQHVFWTRTADYEVADV